MQSNFSTLQNGFEDAKSSAEVWCCWIVNIFPRDVGQGQDHGSLDTLGLIRLARLNRKVVVLHLRLLYIKGYTHMSFRDRFQLPYEASRPPEVHSCSLFDPFSHAPQH